MIGAGEHDQIGAGKIGLDHGGNGDLRNGNILGEHRLHDPRAAGDVNQLDVEPVLLEQLRLFGHPQNRHRPDGGRIGDFDLGLRCDRADEYRWPKQ